MAEGRVHEEELNALINERLLSAYWFAIYRDGLSISIYSAREAARVLRHLANVVSAQRKARIFNANFDKNYALLMQCKK